MGAAHVALRPRVQRQDGQHGRAGKLWEPPIGLGHEQPFCGSEEPTYPSSGKMAVQDRAFSNN